MNPQESNYRLAKGKKCDGSFPLLFFLTKGRNYGISLVKMFQNVHIFSEKNPNNRQRQVQIHDSAK